MPRPSTRSANRWPPGFIVLLIAVALQLQGCRSLVDPLFRSRADLEGRVVTESADASVVVYLEPLAGARSEASPPLVPVRASTSSSGIVAAAPGQPVEFVVNDAIRHKLFSYDEKNAFELEMNDAAVPSRVMFEHPGLVHFYCSLHPAEGGRILVTPSSHFAYAGDDGRFRIANVPAGPYRLKTWGPQTRPTDRAIRLPREESESPLEIFIRAAAESGE